LIFTGLDIQQSMNTAAEGCLGLRQGAGDEHGPNPASTEPRSTAQIKEASAGWVPPGVPASQNSPSGFASTARLAGAPFLKYRWYRDFFTILLITLLLTPLIGGCQKKGEVNQNLTEEASLTLPGAKEVMAAIDRKDYQTAVADLFKIRESLTTDEQRAQFIVLAKNARDKLSAEALKDEKAAEAAGVIRQLTTGR
jgi:hypothetical protein